MHLYFFSVCTYNSGLFLSTQLIGFILSRRNGLRADGTGLDRGTRS